MSPSDVPYRRERLHLMTSSSLIVITLLNAAALARDSRTSPPIMLETMSAWLASSGNSLWLVVKMCASEAARATHSEVQYPDWLTHYSSYRLIALVFLWMLPAAPGSNQPLVSHISYVVVLFCFV